jgi:hypothetical protein
MPARSASSVAGGVWLNPGDRVDPVPGLPGDDRVERTAGRVPRLEPRDLDLEPTPAGGLGHPGVDFDTEHPAAGRLEAARGDAGADADVEHLRSGACGE